MNGVNDTDKMLNYKRYLRYSYEEFLYTGGDLEEFILICEDKFRELEYNLSVSKLEELYYYMEDMACKMIKLKI